MCICLQYNIQTVCVCTYVYAAAAAKSLQSCPTVLPHRRQPTRLLCPWDSPGKNTGVDFHFLLQCMKVKWKWSHWVVSDSLRPHGLSPTRLLPPWDSPGKSTGVGCHFLLQGMKVKSESEVAQSCPTLSDSMDCRLPGFSVHGIFQARVLEWDNPLRLYL